VTDSILPAARFGEAHRRLAKSSASISLPFKVGSLERNTLRRVPPEVDAIEMVRRSARAVEPGNADLGVVVEYVNRSEAPQSTFPTQPHRLDQTVPVYLLRRSIYEAIPALSLSF